jgi:hypothetical protein
LRSYLMGCTNLAHFFDGLVLTCTHTVVAL